MSEETKKREVLGILKCYSCGKDVEARLNKRGHIYYMCSWGQEGCGANFQSRTDDCDRHLLNKIEKKRTTAKTVSKTVEEKPTAQPTATAFPSAKAEIEPKTTKKDDDFDFYGAFA